MHFHLEKTTLWPCVILAKYGSTHFDLKPGTLSLYSSYGLWKFIDAVKAKGIVIEHINIKISRGDKTSFLERQMDG